MRIGRAKRRQAGDATCKKQRHTEDCLPVACLLEHPTHPRPTTTRDQLPTSRVISRPFRNFTSFSRMNVLNKQASKQANERYRFAEARRLRGSAANLSSGKHVKLFACRRLRRRCRRCFSFSFVNRRCSSLFVVVRRCSSSLSVAVRRLCPSLFVVLRPSSFVAVLHHSSSSSSLIVFVAIVVVVVVAVVVFASCRCRRCHQCACGSLHECGTGSFCGRSDLVLW